MSSDFLYSPQKYFMLCSQEAFLLEQASLGLVWDSKFLRVHYVLRGCTTFTHSMPDIKSRKNAKRRKQQKRELKRSKMVRFLSEGGQHCFCKEDFRT